MAADARLTRRALEVAELIAAGLTNRDIATRLFLSERTVEWHVEQIMNKLTWFGLEPNPIPGEPNASSEVWNFLSGVSARA